ncbi:hypothetical protein J4G37_25110 [Microvirga sp. 3-52]|nr:hypothetical protein [Microvirga sp. 3-52]
MGRWTAINRLDQGDLLASTMKIIGWHGLERHLGASLPRLFANEAHKIIVQAFFVGEI